MPTVLPTPITRFVGRARELNELRGLMSSARLITLTGPGGSGKTRLVLQLASDFSSPVHWADLSTVIDSDQVADSVRRELGVGEQPDRSSRDLVIDFLRDRSALLVFDNCEQISAAVAALAQALLDECGAVWIVATSLQPLSLPCETVYAVPPLGLDPLPLPDRKQEPSEAVQLFLDRARDIRPSFEATAANLALIDTICRRLDGLPLAIELAAARVKMISVAQIADRLEDAFRLLTRGTPAQAARHQTLRATMEWSYQFLSPPEQTLLRQLAVFAGSFSIEMIEASCLQTSAVSALDVLTDLADKSFVTIVPHDTEAAVRYRLLETIRQYAREKLVESGEAEQVYRGLTEWALRFAVEAEPQLATADQAAWLNRLELERDNLRAALRWTCHGDRVESGLQLANTLWRFWMVRGYFAEGRAWLEELLACDAQLTERRADPQTRARALYHASALALRQGDLTRAAALAAESLRYQREANDQAGIAAALNVLAILATERGDHERAARLHEEALALRRAQHDPAGISTSLINLGVIARGQGDYRRATALYEEALSIKRQLDDKVNVALALNNLSELAVFCGDYAHAVTLAEESLALCREIGNRQSEAVALNNMGAALRQLGESSRAAALTTQGVQILEALGKTAQAALARTNLADLACDHGDRDRAWAIYQECLAIFRRFDDARSTALSLRALGVIAGERGDETQATVLYQDSLTLYQAAHYRLGIVEALEALAGVLAQRGEWQRAARCLAACEAQRAAMSAPLLSTERPRYREIALSVRRALGESAWLQVQAQACDLPLDQVVSEVLQRETVNLPSADRAQPVLRIYALGSTRVIAGERLLTSTDWTYTKAKELLFYFIAQPPVTKAQIGLDVWPEASADQLRNIFHRALHHLRKAIGQPEGIIFADETYSFNRALNYWCDLHEFEALFGSIGSITNLKPADRSAAIQRLESAVQLWRGDFVEDLDAGEWAIFQREELRQRYVQALIDLGALHFADAHYDRAAAVYRRLLALDAYLELAHRELMRCFVRQGEVGHALQHYQHLREMLKRELQAEPSPETVMVYERVKRGDEV